MIEDVFEGVFRVFGRFIGYIVIEIIFELLLKGPGYFIYKLFSKKNSDPDELTVLLLGLMFWSVVGILCYMVYMQL